jgi:hypothetical protein
MTPIYGTPRRNQAESRTAFALHRRAAMRLAAVCLALAVPVAARAQMTGGSCSGMLAGSVGLSVPDGKGGFATIQAAAVSSVFGNAECACAPQDSGSQIQFEIKLTTALPLGTSGSAEVWVGSQGCETYATRSQQNSQCQKIASPNIQNFAVGGSTSSTIEIPVPGDAIVSPNRTPHDCSPMTNPTGSNEVFLILFNDASSPFATCKLPLNEQNQGPSGVSNVAASSGDGAVTVNWSLPSPGSYNPTYFQVLCADDCGNPVNSSPSSAQAYSTCINGVLSRRQLNTGGNPPGTGDGGTDDAGTSSPDLAPRLVPPPLDNEQRVPSPRPNASPFSCAADMGSSSMGDMGAFAGGALGPLATLDPKYICSSQLQATQNKARITGLNNYQLYHFMVLSIDQFGNPTASTIVDGTPQPTEDLWRRYRDEGGGPGGCVVGTGALDAYERWVWALFAATMLAVWLLRRRNRT